ncbi:hypothetical protein ACH4FX_42480 [Streptomyces sp. NPDC018019]|uniref:hypothetical protein n=1 Tax=Streptomyces sp. NPDC018019 TaxID=3365030 RepID=UPI0037A8C62E
MKTAMPLLRASGNASVINTSSVLGVIGSEGGGRGRRGRRCCGSRCRRTPTPSRLSCAPGSCSRIRRCG